jgi:hypothetical protein
MTSSSPLQTPQQVNAFALGLWLGLLLIALALPNHVIAQGFGNPAAVQDQPSTVLTPFLGGFGPNEPPTRDSTPCRLNSLKPLPCPSYRF